MSYSIHHIARIIAAEPVLANDRLIEHLLLDSRKVYSPASSLYFAIAGPRRDGHQFIPDLYKRGVRNFVLSNPVATNLYPDANFLFVKNTSAALQELAAFHRQQFNIPVIGITGSNGKTIVKEWLYQLLHDEFAIVRSPKSYNSQIGVPLSVWQLNAQHSLAIFEAGISQPGEMDKLENIIRPTIGVLTNIGEAHSAGFTDVAEKVKEKIKLFSRSSSIVYSRDSMPLSTDPAVLYQEGVSTAALYHWSKQQPAWLQITGIDKAGVWSTIHAIHQGAELSVSIPFIDDASIENAITCWVVLLLLKMDFGKIEAGMKNLQPVNMRLELKKGINNCSVINDSYSADLSSLEIALNFLDQQSSAEKKTAILSDFLQTGLASEALYNRIARALKDHLVNKVIGIGAAISKYLPAALGPSFAQEYFPTTDSFIQQYRFSQFREEAVLIKGARSFAFEQVVQLLEQKVHQTVLEINLNAIAHNLKEYQKMLKPSTKIMAMVKAFAYGSGGAEITSILQYHQVDYLGVAYADEGVELRKAGITLPVMVMNPDENAFESIIENNLEPEIYSFELLNSFDKFLEKQGLQQYPVHIEIETGMNRLGFSAGEIEKLASAIQASSSFKIQSVFSHLAASEEAAQDEFTFHQFAVFEKAASLLQEKIGYTFIRHISNSAAVIRHPDLQLDMIRLGIGLYGVDSAGGTAIDTPGINLQTVATLKSTIAQLKQLKKGESVSYNRKGVVEKDSLIATIRIGYADGYPRRLSNGAGKVWLRNQFAPVIGTVCMDMFMIDVTDIPNVQEGDDVIIFGEQLPVGLVATWADTIPYEIMTGISQRVKRVYFEE